MNIKLNYTSFDNINSFHLALNQAIVNRFLFRCGIISINRTVIPRDRVIVTYNNIRVELKLKPNIGGQYNIIQFKELNRDVIIEFRNRVTYLLNHRSLDGYNNKNSLHGIEDFNSEKVFNTIEYFMKEIKKKSTPIIYTGMTN